MKISDKAICTAREYVGDVEAKGKANDASWLRILMEWGKNPAKWRPGDAYCIAALLSIFNRHCLDAGKSLPFIPSASTQVTYGNAKALNLVSDIPSVGDIVIFRKGDSWQGHAGLVTNILHTDMGFPYGVETIEFNTSGMSSGDQRNGEGCYAKKRLFKDFSPGRMTPRKLWIRGYIKTSNL